MTTIALIKEGKIPADNRVALTPAQCKWIHSSSDEVRVVVQSSLTRCFSDREYQIAGVEVREDISDCDIFFGIKEVPVTDLIANKIYLFFSHTRKKQPKNQPLLHAILEKKITLIDYECLEHEDGERIIGFGFFAGVVGAHNGMMAYGNRTGSFKLDRVYKQRSFRELIHTYFGLRIPKMKIVVTGSGRVAHGVLEIMNLMGIHEVEPMDFLKKEFSYPVYTQLKGADLYERKTDKTYSREDFHAHPELYTCKFLPYSFCSDLLLNGIFWDKKMPRLFEKQELQNEKFKIQVIADISDDYEGSIPINLGDQTIEDPVYGVDKKTFQRTVPYLSGSVDVMAVGNLPNELPRDASRYFGEQLIKFVLEDLLSSGSEIITKATIVNNGKLADPFEYLREYAERRER
jgi:alanine dehydrogenase